MEAHKLLEIQNTYFKSGATKSVDFRIHQLQTLKKLLNEHEVELCEAVEKDFRKSAFETYITEMGVLHNEIDFAVKNLRKWAKPKYIRGSMSSFPSRSFTVAEPYGSVLIISPWNYPVHLALMPLIGAIAAGNTAVIKPSELSSHTSSTIAKLISKWFKQAYITVAEGGVEVSQALLKQDFDYIFFTGSARVGKIVMRAAAENLTPVTLELGGKSPCIIDETADLKTTAKRIVWGKFLNAGQTCIAPDYLLVQDTIKKELLDLLKDTIHSFYDINPKLSPDYPRIINEHHFDRLTKYLDNGNVFYGGKTDREQRYIEPTILDDISTDDLIMQDEIFGPILPVLTFSEYGQAINIINAKDKPMALYLFSKNSEAEKLFFQSCSFGGGAVNDVILQIANHNLPFGGVGKSGTGSYHGKKSFETFSHTKSVVKKPFWIDIPLRYPPYYGKLKWIKRFLK